MTFLVLFFYLGFYNDIKVVIAYCMDKKYTYLGMTLLSMIVAFVSTELQDDDPKSLKAKADFFFVQPGRILCSYFLLYWCKDHVLETAHLDVLLDSSNRFEQMQADLYELKPNNRIWNLTHTSFVGMLRISQLLHQPNLGFVARQNLIQAIVVEYCSLFFIVISFDSSAFRRQVCIGMLA